MRPNVRTSSIDRMGSCCAWQAAATQRRRAGRPIIFWRTVEAAKFSLGGNLLAPEIDTAASQLRNYEQLDNARKLDFSRKKVTDPESLFLKA